MRIEREQRTDVIVICGTTGESSTATRRAPLVDNQVQLDKVNKRVLVIAGTGSIVQRQRIR